MKFFLKQNANHIMKDHTVYMRIPTPIDHHQDIPVKVPDFTGKKIPFSIYATRLTMARKLEYHHTFQQQHFIEVNKVMYFKF